MERDMFKKEREVSLEETERLLELGHHGTLSVNGDDGYPYGVPVNYVYLNKAIYIHSAKYGYKMDAIKENNKVCFSAIISSEIIPSKFTAKFESIIAFGKVELVEDNDEKQMVLETFINNFSPDFAEGGLKFIKAASDKTAIIKINVENVKGKVYRGGSW